MSAGRKQRQPARGRVLSRLPVLFGLALALGIGLGAGYGLVEDRDAASVDCEPLREGFNDLLVIREELFRQAVATRAAPEGGPVVGERREAVARLHEASARLRDFAERHDRCLTEPQRQALAGLRPLPPGPGDRPPEAPRRPTPPTPGG